MNRFLLNILLASFALQVSGQMFPLSDYYGYNTLVINPAFAGCHEALSSTVTYRNQWVGFTGAPKTEILSVHSPTYNGRIGLGLLVERNTIGILGETYISGNYAYRMELKNGKLALGLGFGLFMRNTDWNQLVEADQNDDQLMKSNTSAILPGISLGVYYYSKKYFIGFSIPSVLNYVLDKGNGRYKIGNSFSSSTFFLSTGYEFNFRDRLKFLPSLLVKYHPENVLQIDYNTQLGFNDRIWLGIGYRNRQKLTGMIQCQVNYQFRVAYSYDFDLSRPGKYINGSHEVLLNYIFRYSRRVAGPRQF